MVHFLDRCWLNFSIVHKSLSSPGYPKNWEPDGDHKANLSHKVFFEDLLHSKHAFWQWPDNTTVANSSGTLRALWLGEMGQLWKFLCWTWWWLLQFVHLCNVFDTYFWSLWCILALKYDFSKTTQAVGIDNTSSTHISSLLKSWKASRNPKKHLTLTI